MNQKKYNKFQKYKKIVNCKCLGVTQGKKGAFIIDEKYKVYSCPAFMKEATKKNWYSGDTFLSLISLKQKVNNKFLKSIAWKVF